MIQVVGCGAPQLSTICADPVERCRIPAMGLWYAELGAVVGVPGHQVMRRHVCPLRDRMWHVSVCGVVLLPSPLLAG